MSEHHVLFTGEINPASSNNFIVTLVNLIAQKADRVTIAINSSGGNVISGIAMHNAMLAMPYPIVTHNIGNVDSIANVVFLAGKERFACPTSTFMFHGVGFNGNANERLEENVLKAKLDTVLSDHKRISRLIATRTNDKIRVNAGMRLFKEQRTRNAQWALDNGFIDGVRDFAFPVGGPIHLLIN